MVSPDASQVGINTCLTGCRLKTLSNKTLVGQSFWEVRAGPDRVFGLVPKTHTHTVCDINILSGRGSDQ